MRILVLSGLATMANAMGEAKLLEVEELKGDVTKGKDSFVVIEEGHRSGLGTKRGTTEENFVCYHGIGPYQ